MNILQKRIQKKSHLQEIGGLLYSECLAQARLPSFYTDLDVPDTIDGRFDLLVFHLFIVIYVMEPLEKNGKELSQSLFDITFRDLERAIREMGIGDLSVPKHMKRMMEGFHGRCTAYKQALKTGTEDALMETIARNIYGKKLEECSIDNVNKLYSYMNSNISKLSDMDLCAGNIKFEPITMK
jgi:cytochrome b pre-mRNA-processing protein 3